MQTGISRTVLFVAFEKVASLDVSGPLSVFCMASQFLAERRVAGYDCRLVTVDGGPVISDQSVKFLSEPVNAFSSLPVDTIIVAGSPTMTAALNDRRLIAWISERGRDVRRLCSVCTGAFLLAEAGVLNGRRAATHWAECDRLQTRYPEIVVEPDSIFVRDGPIWSSAGMTSGIDLALALIQEDHGRALAMRIAREHVVFLKRPGGQSQFSVFLQSQAADEDAFAGLHKWLVERLSDPKLAVETLAEQVHMSPRNFARVYKAKVGRTPAKTIELFRLEAARRLLEETGERIDIVAQRTGFGDEERMRTTFQRNLNVSPRNYRERFSQRETN